MRLLLLSNSMREGMGYLEHARQPLTDFLVGKVERLLLEEGMKIAKELYLGLLVDRAAGCPVFLLPYGYNEGRDVREFDADAIIASVDEALELIEG